jgi:hypothetical protein
MRDLPPNSIVHIEREADFDKVVMSHPSSASGRASSRLILVVVGLVPLGFWIAALVDLLDGRFGFMDVMQLLFTTLFLGFIGFMGKFAFRRRVPESVMVVGGGIIHDSGTDPFRNTAIDKSQARQSEQFVKPRKRIHFSPAEVATLSKTDIPYENRIYVEADGKRHDLGEALSPAERAWLHDFLLEKLDRPEALNLQASDLINQVEAEERIKSIITDVHSGHRVDPLDFDDPVAQRAGWETMADTSANFQTHRLVFSGDQLAFKMTRSAGLFALIFPAVGLIALGFSIRQFVINGIAAESVFLFIFGCIFSSFGLYLVRKTLEPIVFNIRRGQFRKGWSDARPIPMAEVYGLQLLSFTTTGEGIHTGYELNLLLRDGSRRHVLCHGDRDSLRADTDALSRFLSRPVFDGIVPKRQQSYTAMPYSVEDRSFSWAPIASVIFVLGGIVVWTLGGEILDGADREERIVIDESASESAAVGRPVSYSVTPPDATPSKSTSRRGTGPSLEVMTKEILPEGVTIENRSIRDGHFRISGFAEDNRAVAEYLRAIQAEGGRPNLESVRTEQRDQGSVSAFSITIDP